MISAYKPGTIRPYFKVDIKTPSGTSTVATEQDIGRDVKSFKVKEKVGELLTGEIQINDWNGGIYDKLIRIGAQLNIEWGVRKFDPLYSGWVANEIKGFAPRKALVTVIAAPFNFDNGVVTYTAQFRIRSSNNTLPPRQQTYKSGVLRSVITDVCDRLGWRYVINFNSMGTALTSKNQLVQSGNDLEFLRHISNTYNINFVVQTLATGTTTVFMLDWTDTSTIPANMQLRGLTGIKHYFDYGSLDSNIIGGGGNTNLQSSGGSSFYTTTSPTGEVQVVFTPSGTDTAEVWELNPEKVKEALRGKPIAEQAKLTQMILAADEKQFIEELRPKYFSKKVATTAPEGAGQTCTFQVAYNTDYQVGDLVHLGGTPGSTVPPHVSSREGDQRSLWRMTMVDAGISDGGPSMSVELAR